MKINSSYAITSTQILSLYDHGVGFVFKHGKIDYDFKYVMNATSISITFNDDASWAVLELEDEILRGRLFSYLQKPVNLHWQMLQTDFIEKPQAKTPLQAIRFHDATALSLFKGEVLYSELLIEAATCGHEEVLELCLSKGAQLHVNIETFKEDSESSCFALTKAISCGHIAVVKRLLQEKPQLLPKHFDPSRDNFYQACFLYQSRPDVATQMIRLLLDYGMDFQPMSAYYLTAVMFSFKDGPLSQAQEDTKMLEELLDAHIPMNEYLLIQAHEQDTPFMFAAHMGLAKPLELLHKRGADIFKSFEGIDALHRAEYATLHDPQMPSQGSLKIQEYLLSLGFIHKDVKNTEEVVEETTQNSTKESVSSLESLFNLKK